jgi:hypothetical protein
MPAQVLQSKILIGFVFVVLADCARSDTRSIDDAALSDTSQGASCWHVVAR